MKLAFVAVAVGVAALATSAQAADIPAPVLPGPVVVAPPAPVQQGFDWSRPYVGAVAGAWLELPGFGLDDWRASGVAGIAFGNRFIVGAEVQAGIYDFASPIFEAFGLGRIGVAIGSRLQVFGTAGVNWDGDLDLVAGGGVELGLGNRLSFRTDTLLYWGNGVAAAPDLVSVTGGLIFHFGR